MSGSTPTFAPDGAAAYLAIIEPSRSWRRVLPDNGVLVIGRGDACDVGLEDPSASRRHAELRLSGGKAVIVDLKSHNGTIVNRESVVGEHLLVPGDVITICATTLVYHAPARRSRGPRIVEREAFHDYVAIELDRALGQGRRLGMMVVVPPPGRAVADIARALAPALRAHDVLAFDGAARLMIALPEIDGDELAARGASAIALATGARIGGALAPDDGSDPAVLLAAARDAAASRLEGQYASAATMVKQLELGGRRILVADPAMLHMYALVERIASSDLPVLVLGETGVGKESVATAVHHGSLRRNGPLIAVNCAAMPDTLADSALFGHERGAFSGAVAAHAGHFEAADKGTLFLDEIGELSLAIQAKLLRALDTGSIQRVGGTQLRSADVRVVAATNRDLRAEVSAGKFREDLYFRLGGAVVRVPPLRERARELPVLARELLAQACTRRGRALPRISVSAMEALARHPWPGNVRELRNAMELAAAAIDGEDDVETWHLPEAIIDLPELEPSVSQASTASVQAAPTRFRPIAEELRELERRRMVQALTAADGVQTRAAELLQMPRRTFVAKMREYELHALFSKPGVP